MVADSLLTRILAACSGSAMETGQEGLESEPRRPAASLVAPARYGLGPDVQLAGDGCEGGEVAALVADPQEEALDPLPVGVDSDHACFPSSRHRDNVNMTAQRTDVDLFDVIKVANAVRTLETTISLAMYANSSLARARLMRDAAAILEVVNREMERCL